MSKANTPDPFWGLKHIAYYRTGLPNVDGLGMAELIDYAKWQICKVRNVLWHDPIWHEYTDEEILVEFFAINFDANPEARADFERAILKPKVKDLEWFDQMERQVLAENAKKAKGLVENPQPDKIVVGEDFDDTFPG